MNQPDLKKTVDFKLPMGILAASLAPDDKSLVAGCLDGVYLCDLESKQSRKLYAHESYVSSVEYVSEELVISAGYDGMIRWFDVVANQPIRSQKLHDFWSWDMAISPDKQWLASVTGQYLAGGYRYQPQPEREPSLKIVSVASGDTLQSLPHVPSVQAVAISPDSRLVAAGNLMGEVRVFDIATGKLESQFTTPDLTSWGIIKSHCYLGGIFAMQFTPVDHHLLICGMGQMRDPMAGNGRQLWQKWNWQADRPSKIGETHQGESGEGLMETLAVSDAADHFVMGGRLRGGDWNVALFDHHSGKRVAAAKTGYRITQAQYTRDATGLLLVGAQGQPKQDKQGKFSDFGRVEVYQL